MNVLTLIETTSDLFYEKTVGLTPPSMRLHDPESLYNYNIFKFIYISVAKTTWFSTKTNYKNISKE